MSTFGRLSEHVATASSRHHTPFQAVVCTSHPCLIPVSILITLYSDKEHNLVWAPYNRDDFLILSRYSYLLGWSGLGRLGRRSSVD